MKLSVQPFDVRHLPMVDAFSCMETEDELAAFNAKERRRVKLHSGEIDEFLRTEALVEQEQGLNTTFLFVDDEASKIAAFVSLCNDSIVLDPGERDDLGFPYTTVPAMKIARLAVSSGYKHQGLEKLLVEFAAYIGQEVKSYSGVSFLTLDCYEHRVSFYESIGFARNALQPVELPYDSPISMRLLLTDYLAAVDARPSFAQYSRTQAAIPSG